MGSKLRCSESQVGTNRPSLTLLPLTRYESSAKTPYRFFDWTLRRRGCSFQEKAMPGTDKLSVVPSGSSRCLAVPSSTPHASHPCLWRKKTKTNPASHTQQYASYTEKRRRLKTNRCDNVFPVELVKLHISLDFCLSGPSGEAGRPCAAMGALVWGRGFASAGTRF